MQTILKDREPIAYDPAIETVVHVDLLKLKGRVSPAESVAGCYLPPQDAEDPDGLVRYHHPVDDKADLLGLGILPSYVQEAPEEIAGNIMQQVGKLEGMRLRERGGVAFHAERYEGAYHDGSTTVLFDDTGRVRAVEFYGRKRGEEPWVSKREVYDLEGNAYLREEQKSVDHINWVTGNEKNCQITDLQPAFVAAQIQGAVSLISESA